MKIATLMHEDVKCCRPEDTLDTAASLMWSFDIGSLPVVDANARLVGMITDRDICIAAHTQGLRLADLRVSSAMTVRVVAGHPDDDVAIASMLMGGNHVRRLPIIEDDGRIAGMVSIDDLAVVAQHGPADAPSGADVAGTLAAICGPSLPPSVI